MIIWAVFITASILAEEKGHVAATLIVERFSMKTRRYLAVFNGVVALGFLRGGQHPGLQDRFGRLHK